MSDRAERRRRIIASEGPTVRRNTQTFNAGRYEAMADLDDPAALKERAREIKESAIDSLPELLDRLEASIEANGGTVHRAADAADAREVVTSILADRGARTAVKSKSMTTEEIELNDAIEAAGVDVWETDLGEFVVQLASETPSHILGPAVHKPQSAIADLFAERLDLEEPPSNPEGLTAVAREFLGDRIAEADAAITGANFLAADSGTLALVTSEGNARKCVLVPPVHIAVSGIEKVVPTVGDLEPFVQLLARSATGQDHSAYLSLFRPPVATPTVDFDRPDEPIAGSGPAREFHLVLLDNGRRSLRADDELRETLYCIRCSACANSCANFQHAGGHVFGGETYSGGIATGWEAGVHGLDAAASFNDLCTGCTRCAPNCPVGIDIPWINTVVRDRIKRAAEPGRFDALHRALVPGDATPGVDLGTRLVANIDRLASVASATAPVSNLVARSRPARVLLERVAGIDRRRPFPRASRRTFRDRWADHEPRENGHRRVVLYPDVYTNHFRPDRGMAAVRALEAVGVTVRVPSLPESGRAPFSQGLLGRARSRARETAAALAPLVDAGADVVVIEPSDLAMFRREYDRLLEGSTAERLAGGSYDLFEYLYGCLSKPWADAAGLAAGDGAPVVYHPHCQARTVGVAAYTPAVLRDRGYEVSVTSAECCGMAGSFGYGVETYDLSVAVGESLVDEVDDLGPGMVAASGTSCLEQLEGLGDREPRHPVELVAPGG